jgi:hypothetical protein
VERRFGGALCTHNVGHVTVHLSSGHDVMCEQPILDEQDSKSFNRSRGFYVPYPHVRRSLSSYGRQFLVYGTNISIC